MATNGYLAFWPASDPRGAGTFDNGSAEYFSRDDVRCIRERDTDGLLRLGISHAKGKSLTLEQIVHARRALCEEAHVMVWAVPTDIMLVTSQVCLLQMSVKEDAQRSSASGLLIVK